MWSDMSASKSPVSLWLLSGIWTAPGFMEQFRVHFEEQVASSGRNVRSALLYPYGDWSRGKWSQLREARHDLLLPMSKRDRSIGGNRAASEISKTGSNDEAIVLIGHSAGGIASIHAGELLRRRSGLNVSAYVQIGSPKQSIPDEVRERVLFLAGSSGDGYSGTDPICRIGSWGGCKGGRRGIPRWDRRRFAPAGVISLRLAGKHPDYFRLTEAFRSEGGLYNGELVARAVLDWIKRLDV